MYIYFILYMIGVIYGLSGIDNFVVRNPSLHSVTIILLILFANVFLIGILDLLINLLKSLLIRDKRT